MGVSPHFYVQQENTDMQLHLSRVCLSEGCCPGMEWLEAAVSEENEQTIPWKHYKVIPVLEDQLPYSYKQLNAHCH
jgi:hypothetical protein